MKANIDETNQERVVIVGGGFGGLKLARKLSKYNLQIVLIDKNNYHQFQPLFYQVATAGLEPSTISFPFRKIFQKNKNVFFRIAEVNSIDTKNSYLISSIGKINYDYLVIAIGTDTNFFGNQKIGKFAMPMKSVSEALEIRNKILQNYEDALSVEDKEEQQTFMNIVVVGGGPTGVEVAGTLAEMKKYILPKDYPELEFNRMKIYLLEGSARLLNGMSETASQKAKLYLEKLGVTVNPGAGVKDYDGEQVFLQNGSAIKSKMLIWAAGVIGNKIEGLSPEALAKGNRIKVDQFNRVIGYDTVFAIGDIALMAEKNYPNGHPQVAQVAIQQAECLTKNFRNILKNKPLKQFHYKNKGSLATIGRNLAVADLPGVKLYGFFAWIIWMFIHLMSIVGVKNRVFIFIDWALNYITYDQSLRLIIRPKKSKKD